MGALWAWVVMKQLIRLKIKWPGGKVQTFSDVTVDQIRTITEE